MPKKMDPIQRTELDKLLLKNQSKKNPYFSEEDPESKIHSKCWGT